MTCNLGGHDVGRVLARNGDQNIRVLRGRLAQIAFESAVADDGYDMAIFDQSGGQQVERRDRYVEDLYRGASLRHGGGNGGAGPAAADDHDRPGASPDDRVS